MNEFVPSYLQLASQGGLAGRAEQAASLLVACRLCGWDCAINRGSELGPCRTGLEIRVATAYLHFGEERPLVGQGGSGAIFFAGCDLRCQFCQTARWNVLGKGYVVDIQVLANLMLRLQDQGAVNINLVTPTHVAPHIVQAVHLGVARGLRIPLVWNSGGYDSPSTLALLDGLVDIYLPDMKYSDPGLARRLSNIRNYPSVNQAAVQEMHRQTGDLALDEWGVARHGVLIRHLVMPGHLANTQGVLTWVAQNLGQNTYLSLMDQYRPAYRAFARADIARPLSHREYEQARQMALSLGLTRLDDNLVMTFSDSGQQVAP